MSDEPPRRPSHADWLRLVAPRLDRALAPPTSLVPWFETARDLPADGPAVLEVGLGPGAASSVDFSWRLANPSRSTSSLHCFPSHPSLAFLTDGWSSLGHPEPISAVWLELDAPEGPAGREGPAGTPTLPMVIPRLAGRVDPEWLAEGLVPALRIDAAEDPAYRRAVARAVAAIPEPGRVLYVFSLAARGRAGSRLETVGLPVAQMPEVLAQLGADRGARQIEGVAALASGVDRPHLSFDLDPISGGARVGERIGLELGFRRQPDREPGWDRLLDRLERAGLCTAEQRRALLAWCGSEHLRSAGDRWPTGARGHCLCCLSHLKLVLRHGAALEAKAYLLFENFVPPRWETAEVSAAD